MALTGIMQCNLSPSLALLSSNAFLSALQLGRLTAARILECGSTPLLPAPTFFPSHLASQLGQHKWPERVLAICLDPLNSCWLVELKPLANPSPPLLVPSPPTRRILLPWRRRVTSLWGCMKGRGVGSRNLLISLNT